jgi:hypothetical protein
MEINTDYVFKIRYAYLLTYLLTYFIEQSPSSEADRFTASHLMEPEGSIPYSLPNIVRVVKSRRKIWTGHVARMG